MMKSKRLKEHATNIAGWWAVQIQRRLNQDNGGDGHVNMLSNGMMCELSWDAQSKILPEQIKLFKDIIVCMIVEYYKDNPSINYISVGCDYHPTKILDYAFTASGIDVSCCPIKHDSILRIREDIVEVKSGYAATPLKLTKDISNE